MYERFARQSVARRAVAALCAFALLPVPAMAPSFAKAEEAGASGTSVGQQAQGYAATHLIAVFAQGTTYEQAQQLAAAPQVAGVRDLVGIAPGSPSSDEYAYALLELAPEASAEEAASSIGAYGFVRYVQPDFELATPVESLSLPELLASAHGLTVQAASDPYRSQQWYLENLNLPAAWSLVGDLSNAAERPAVAVLDAGFDATHPDLAANVLATYDAYDGDADVGVNLYLTTLSNDHGTSVAGAVSAASGNGIGIAGAANNAGLVLIKLFDDYGNAQNTSSMLRAFHALLDADATGVSMASKYNVRVISTSVYLSWNDYRGAMQHNTSLYEQIQRAQNAGIVTVAAAGNAESSVITESEIRAARVPGDYANVVSVMALDRNDALASWSFYNATDEHLRDICAPGQNLFMLANRQKTDGYATGSGTSFSAPLVAGVLALEFAANPQLTAQEAIDILYASAKDLGAEGWDRTYGYGEADAAAAVTAAFAAAGTPVAVKTGWQKEGGRWYFYDEDGTPHKGWLTYKNRLFYFSRDDGHQLTGFWKLDGKTYYLQASAGAAKGWKKIGNYYYYFNTSTGVMATGWKKLSGAYYYFTANGRMFTGWLHTGGAYYYFYPSTGRMATSIWIGDRYVNARGRWVASR